MPKSHKEPLDSHGEFVFGPFANLNYILGRLDKGWPDNPKQRIEMYSMLDICFDWLEYFGFRVSARCTENISDILKNDEYNSINQLHDNVTALRQALMTELESTAFIQVDYKDAVYFRESRRDWEQVIQRFGDTVSDIEEASKCYALGRYPATVFHCMQIAEHGLLALGTFLQITDPKSGFTAVSNELRRIINKKHSDLNDFEKINYTFLEQMNASIQALKDAYRNKINHAQGRYIVMTADFSPQVALEIYMTTRNFMRRLATDLPR